MKYNLRFTRHDVQGTNYDIAWLFIIIGFLLLGNGLLAQQDSLLLSKNFKFDDGIYMSFNDFHNNKPSYTWDEVNARLATSDEGFVAQVEYIKKNQQKLDLQQVWGVCIGGIPYIRLPQGEVTDAATVFAGLRVRGKICYFKYKDEETELVDVKAYNPLNGRPYREGKVPVERTVQHERMLNFQTGEIVDFTTENLLDWIQDDRQLWNTLHDLPTNQAKEKLFKCLLIYIDRNNVYLPNER